MNAKNKTKQKKNARKGSGHKVKEAWDLKLPVSSVLSMNGQKMRERENIYQEMSSFLLLQY